MCCDVICLTVGDGVILTVRCCRTVVLGTRWHINRRRAVLPLLGARLAAGTVGWQRKKRSPQKQPSVATVLHDYL